MAIAVPTSHRILEASSGATQRFADGKVEPGDDAQTLTIDFLNPVRDDIITIEIHSEPRIQH